MEVSYAVLQIAKAPNALQHQITAAMQKQDKSAVICISCWDWYLAEHKWMEVLLADPPCEEDKEHE